MIKFHCKILAFILLINFSVNYVNATPFIDSLTIQNNFKKQKNNNKSPLSEIFVPVGNIDIDEQINDLQLLGKISSSYSLAIRPFFANSILTYDSLLKLIDTSIRYNGNLYRNHGLKIRLLPISTLQKFNSNFPYGGNDASLNLSRGYQSTTSAGVGVKYGPFNLILKPEFINISNKSYETTTTWGYIDRPIQQFLLGNSSFKINFWKLTFGLSNENMWYGPGKINSLLMSNNAPGFLHYSIGTTSPIKTFFGLIEFNLISGKLTQNIDQGFEIRRLRPKLINQNDRYLNEIIFNFQPKFLKNISFGVIRAFQNYSNNSVSKSFITNYLPVLNGIFKNRYNDDNLSRDQLLSLYSRWLMPKNNSEIYFEFGYNDSKLNSRDLLLDMSHSATYLFGFKKLQILNNRSYLSLGFEAIKLAQTPSYIHRNAGNWYEHSTIIEGYTNKNQIIGAGAGFGNISQQLNIAFNKSSFKIGVILEHTIQDPYALVSGTSTIYLRTFNWTQFAYGLNSKFKFKNIMFSGIMTKINSKNHGWIENLNQSNLFLLVNIIYLW